MKNSETGAPIEILTQKVVCFHDEFYCIGSDINAVRQGIKNENSYKRYYAQFHATKEGMMKENEEIWCLPTVEPLKTN